MRTKLPGVPNFRWYHPGVFSASGRPHNFAPLKAAGCRMFVTWETLDEAPHLEARCDAAGLEFFRIGVKDEHAPTRAQAELFLAMVADPNTHPLHTACAGGEHRTGLACCLVRVTFDGWTVAEALKEAERFDIPHFGIPAALIRLWEGGPLAPAQEAFLRDWGAA